METETWWGSTRCERVLKHTHTHADSRKHINNVPSGPSVKLWNKWKHSWRWFTNLQGHAAKWLCSDFFFFFFFFFFCFYVSLCAEKVWSNSKNTGTRTCEIIRQNKDNQKNQKTKQNKKGTSRLPRWWSSSCHLPSLITPPPHQSMFNILKGWLASKSRTLCQTSLPHLNGETEINALIEARTNCYSIHDLHFEFCLGGISDFNTQDSDWK